MKSHRREIKHILAAGVVLAGVGLAVRRVAADAPAGRYTIANGTVYDTKTRLTWQQGVSSTVHTWAGGASYCTGNVGGLPGTGWRVPSLTELQTIVDDSRSSPA